MNTYTSSALLLVAGVVAGPALAQPIEVLVSQDYMSSGFFQSDFLRGEEPNSARASNRATSPTIFGVNGETAYFEFDFDFGSLSGPVTSAVFRVETVTTGFFGDPSDTNPAEVSIHSLTADPLSAIDQNLGSGPGSWLDFRDTQITTGSIVSTTTVDGLGIFEWDVTTIVNEWILNGDANFAYTLGTSALLDPEGEAAVAFVNSSFADLGGELTARIFIIPAPGAAVLFALSGVLIGRRRR